MITVSLPQHGFAVAHTRDTCVPLVCVVDDDPCTRESLEALIQSAGWHSAAFGSADEFLAHPRRAVPTCLVLDIGSFDLQERVSVDRGGTSIVIVTDRADVPITVRAMKRGAIDVLARPFRDEAMLTAIADALEASRAAQCREAEMSALRERHASLTRREREVMAFVVAGRLNKQAAAELGISEITVKAHRGMVMRKMKARTLPALVHMAVRLGLTSPYPS